MVQFPKAKIEEWAGGLAMLAVMLLGGWQALASLQSPAVQAIPVNQKDFLDGHLTAAWAKGLDHNLPWREQLIGWANAGRYLLTRGAGDQVRLGRDDWLFSVEEIQFDAQAQAHAQARVQMMAQAARALDAQGVKVVVALVPDKVRMLAQHLSASQYPDWYSNRYADLLQTIAHAHVPVVDLRPALQSPPGEPERYYRTDTHWNQLGALSAAQAVAQTVHSIAPGLPTARFETRPEGGNQARVGDLLRMMGLQSMPDLLRPRPDIEQPHTTEKLADGAPVGLLGDVAIPVVLVGSSYSQRANFHGYLQQALGAEVLNAAKDGGGFIQSIQAYLNDDAFRTQKPQVIVWEVPERVFSGPLSDAEKKGLPL
jgi:alginate O-acetyltransferase complex protein AlgJ